MKITLKNPNTHETTMVNLPFEFIKNDYGHVALASICDELQAPKIHLTKMDDKLAAVLRERGHHTQPEIMSVRIETGNPLISINCETIEISLKTRPWLADLVQNLCAAKADIAQARNQHHNACMREYQETVERPLLEKMDLEAQEMRKQIPAGGIEVAVTDDANLDGHQIHAYMANGVKLDWSDVTKVGQAYAVRPGALGAFASILVCYTTQDKIAARVQTQKTTEAKRTAEKQELLSKDVPQAALTAYRKFLGDENAAWEAEDDIAWDLSTPGHRTSKRRPPTQHHNKPPQCISTISHSQLATCPVVSEKTCQIPQWLLSHLGSRTCYPGHSRCQCLSCHISAHRP